MSIVKKGLVAVIAMTALTACAPETDSAEEVKMRYHKKCVGYGYADYTESYQSCMKSFMDEHERNRMIERNSHTHMR